jgi:hypothetical protein
MNVKIGIFIANCFCLFLEERLISPLLFRHALVGTKRGKMFAGENNRDGGSQKIGSLFTREK